MENGKWKFDIREENVPFYTDLLDHLERIVDSTETFRDLVNSALDTYYSIINAKSSEKLNVLTMISTIMLPLTFVTGFFGMNGTFALSGFSLRHCLYLFSARSLNVWHVEIF